MQTCGRWKLPDVDRYFDGKLTRRGFEIEKLDAALKYCERFRTAVDGGAHIGTWSSELSKHFDAVIAFEPARDTFECLCQNVSGVDNVVAINMGLGAANQLCSVRDDFARPGNTGSRYITEGGTVLIERLDEMGLDDLDFLKLDVEGYEYFALMGAEATIKSCKPVIIIEDKDFKGRFGVKRGAAVDLLESWGAKQVERIRNDVIFSW